MQELAYKIGNTLVGTSEYLLITYKLAKFIFRIEAKYSAAAAENSIYFGTAFYEWIPFSALHSNTQIFVLISLPFGADIKKQQPNDYTQSIHHVRQKNMATYLKYNI